MTYKRREERLPPTWISIGIRYVLTLPITIVACRLRRVADAIDISRRNRSEYISLWRRWKSIRISWNRYLQGYPRSWQEMRSTKRMEAIAGNPGTREYSREKLSFFFRIDDFMDPQRARRWSAFSAADPETAARNLGRALKTASLDDRRRIRDEARREIVWTLVRIAWRSSAFHDAVTALALLAEAENEPWGNNATGEFVARYQVVLGGSALPYVRRLRVIDELLESGRPELARLCTRALARVGEEGSVTRDVVAPPSDEVPEREWEPQSGNEHLECIDNALARLETVVALGIPALQADLVAAADDLSPLLRHPESRERVAHFLRTVRDAYPGAREPLRRAVADVMRLFKKDLPPGQRRELATLHAQFEDGALGARLEQYAGPASWEREESPDFASLATELLAAPAVLEEYWPWLTSGDASSAWQLGGSLAKADAEGRLSDALPAFENSGPDLRIVCGYVAARRETVGDEWYERWVTSQCERGPQPIGLIFEVIWRCGVTDRLAALMASILRSRPVSRRVVGQIAYTEWLNTSVDVLESLLRAMADTSHAETAISILQRRMEQVPAEQKHWEPFALELATAVDLIRHRGMPNHYWQQVAAVLLDDYYEEISAAIFKAHAGRQTNGSWFIGNESAVAEVLLACVRQDPGRVWKSLLPYLSPEGEAYLFAIGFPRKVMDWLPVDSLLAWIDELPTERAAERVGPLARMSNMDALKDDTLAARLIGAYGDNQMVAEVFLSRFVSGGWLGPASSHWSDRARALKDVAESTRISRLRVWASAAVQTVRTMAAREKQREDERELLVR